MGAAPDSSIRSGSAAVRSYFVELYSVQQQRDSAQMICHHFLHYNAMLSGGLFLGSCLKQMGWSTNVYQFSLKNSHGETVPSHKYVQEYMHQLDKLEQLPCEKMVQTMIRIYELTEALMDEAQAMQPTVVRTQRPTKISPSPHLFEPRISIDELHAHNDTAGNGSLYISIGGRVLDASGSASYSPGGPYSIFAGHEIGRALSEMSLDERDIDDLDFECTTECRSWATKLGRCYPAVGTLKEFTESKLLPVDLFLYDPDAPKLERQTDEASQKCPLTGQVGASCPLGFGAQSEQSSECPFPFIFLHDPARGWQLHASKAKASLSVAMGLTALCLGRWMHVV